ncbi:MAG: O-antigen ligase family protein [Flavobacterium sp.]|nr:O-antigen ligase family protein [Flavobacterium sp.]
MKIIKSLFDNRYVILLSAMLITIPLNFAYGSITSILFLVVCLFSFNKNFIQFNFSLLLPILLYILMVLSFFWSIDSIETIAALKKEVLFLFMPIVFLLSPRLNSNQKEQGLKLFSFSMVLYALYYMLKATINFIDKGDTKFFFYHDLVSMDLSAIYMSVFSSFAMFYFFSKTKRIIWEQIAMMILMVFILLLSSKSIIFINVLLFICYYIYISKTDKSIKILTLISVVVFLIFSFVCIKRIQERFLLEYETAFVDNTVNLEIGNKKNVVYNLSLSQAWKDNNFKPNDFLPGTALRVFQIRIFSEMLQEHNMFFTGFGMGATQEQIRKKVKQYNLFSGNGEFNFHNQYVQTFAEIGFFGCFILLLMNFVNIKKAFITKDFMHIVFSLTMLILFLTDSFLSRQRGIVFFLTLYCIFNTSSDSVKNEK